SSALVAPYLWRTGDEATRGDGAEGREDGAVGEGGAAAPGPREQVEQAARDAAGVLLLLFLLLLLVLLAALVFGPPVYRTFLLQHLRRPLFPVPPTRQVQHAWRLVEVALADCGLRRRP